MKSNYLLGLALFCFGVLSFGDAKTVTLYEAEHMVNGGKAILVKLPNNVQLNELIREQNVSTPEQNLSIKSIETVEKNATLETKAVVETNTTLEIIKPDNNETQVVSNEVTQINEGVDISMPVTLSVLLNKLSKLTSQTYFCDDDINIPVSNIKIHSIEHLRRYLLQVSNHHLVVVKNSKDASIPVVLKIVNEAL